MMFRNLNDLVQWLRPAAELGAQVPAASILEALDGMESTPATGPAIVREEAAPAEGEDWRTRVRRLARETPDATLTIQEAGEALAGFGRKPGPLNRHAVYRLMERRVDPLPAHQPDGKGGPHFFRAGELVAWMDRRAGASAADDAASLAESVGVSTRKRGKAA
jgi:hypothetical protein